MKKEEIMTPPYATVRAFSLIFSKIRDLNLAEISNKFLENQGLKRFDRDSVKATLKFLGIIDEKGKTTDLYKKLRLEGEPFETSLKGIIESSYGRLLEVLDPPVKSKEDILNTMMTEYGCSKRIATSAVTLFLYLTRKSGMSILEEISEREGPRTSLRAKDRKLREKITEREIPARIIKEETELPARLDVIKSVVRINIDSSWKREDAIEVLKEFRRLLGATKETKESKTKEKGT